MTCSQLISPPHKAKNKQTIMYYKTCSVCLNLTVYNSCNTRSLLTGSSFIIIIIIHLLIKVYKIHKSIASLKQCSDNWLLKLNISKCKIVSYGRHADKNYVYHIKENNQITPLEHEESYKDLGVKFDEKLNIRDRIHNKVHKAYAMLGIIKRNFKYISIDSFILLYKVWLDHFWITVSQYGYRTL